MKRLVLGLGLLLWGWAGVALAQTYEDADAAHDAKDYAKAIAILEPLAVQGNARAMNLIGYMYDFGQGYPKDAKTACDWYEKAVGENDASAFNNLSICYTQGVGRVKDMENGMKLKKRAAELGHLHAQIFLVHYYHSRDVDEARKWGVMAVQAGHAMGRVILWKYKIAHGGPWASKYDIYCVLLMNDILGKPNGYCD